MVTQPLTLQIFAWSCCGTRRAIRHSMKWRLRFLLMKARPLVTFLTLMAVPFLPIVPWVLAAGPAPAPLTAGVAPPEPISLQTPIPLGAADSGDVRGPSPPLDPAAVRKMARRWEVKPIDAS